MKAFLKGARISPKKANLVAALIRTKGVSEAVDTLRFTPKKAAPMLRKLIESAAANAEHNFKQNKDELFTKEIIVNDGPTMKRYIPISKGRMHPILKRTSHITVKLDVREAPKTEKKEEKKEEKAEAKTTTKKTTTAKKPAAKKATTKK